MQAAPCQDIDRPENKKYLNKENHNQEPAGLYIHIPFCIKKCRYCDFFSITDLSLRNKFIDALLHEIETCTKPDIDFDSLYIGGGTPSVFEPYYIEKIINKAKSCFNFDQNIEITIEVNPVNIDMHKLKQYIYAGINRLSIGVQSFDDNSLSFLGRLHLSKDSLRCIKAALKAGFKNIGIDLIYGYAGQKIKDWEKDLKKAASLDISHISCYMLTYSPGTPIYNDMKNKVFSPLSDRTVAKMFSFTQQFLNKAGYMQYEISNFAKQGKKSRHNSKYWSLTPYIGIGPSAHSFIETVRYWNISDVKQYIKRAESGISLIKKREKIDIEQQKIEFIYLGLRRTAGIDTEKLNNRFGKDFLESFNYAAEILRKDEMLRKDRAALTDKGMLFADSIAKFFISFCSPHID